jgi:hypothetical protein
MFTVFAIDNSIVCCLVGNCRKVIAMISAASVIIDATRKAAMSSFNKLKKLSCSVLFVSLTPSSVSYSINTLVAGKHLTT